MTDTFHSKIYNVMKHSNNNFSITKKTQFKKYPWNDNRYIIVIVKWLIKWVLMLPPLPRKLLKWLLKSLLMCVSTIQEESTFFGFRRTYVQILSLSPVTLGSLFKLCKVSTCSSSKIGIIPPSQGFSVHMSLGFFLFSFFENRDNTYKTQGLKSYNNYKIKKNIIKFSKSQD